VDPDYLPNLEVLFHPCLHPSSLWGGLGGVPPPPHISLGGLGGGG
jgi:hypothetical protein